MVLKVVHNEDIRKTNSNVDAIPEFAGLSDTIVKYVVLMYDYDSPYSRPPEDQRRKIVCDSLDVKQYTRWYSTSKIKIDKAIEAYKKLQYDTDHEMLISMKAQLEEWNTLLRKPKKTEKEDAAVLKIFDKLIDYRDKVQKLEEIVGYRSKPDSLASGQRKSSIEEFSEIDD